MKEGWERNRWDTFGDILFWIYLGTIIFCLCAMAYEFYKLITL